MEISKLFVQARSATVQIADGGLYHTNAVYQLFLNGQAAGTADTAVTSLYDLQPETEYVLSVRLGAEEVGQCAFRTARESYTLNVRQFGAVMMWMPFIWMIISILIPTRAKIFLIMSVLRNMVADTVIKPIGAVTT